MDDAVADDSVAFSSLGGAEEAAADAIVKRSNAGFLGDLSTLSEEDHRRFLCTYCAKYTHICDPFQFCYL